MNYATRTALTTQLDNLATTVGRLRRRCEPGSSLAFIADTIAASVDTLDAIVQPTAHDLYLEFYTVCGDHDLALTEALHSADARARHVKAALGIREPA